METEYENTLILEATNLTKDAIHKVSEMHKKMYGVDSIKFKKLYTYFARHLQDFYEDLINSCQMKVEGLEMEVESKCGELLTLQEELNANADLPFDETEPLSAMIEKLEEAISGYKSIKTERMEKYHAILKKETDLCDVMGVPAFPSVSGVPSEEQIKGLHHHVNKLEEEKINRRNTYRTIKDSIIKLMKELEYDDIEPFLDEIINSTEENYNLKLDYFENMKKLEDDLKKDLELACKDVEYLKDRLNKLWERIKRDHDHRASFMKKIKGVGKSFQNMLKNELEICEEIKRANIKPVIQAVRCEIREIWDKLTYTDEHRKRFISFYSETFSEDVLILHELELNRLQTFYEENKHIFDLAEKRESLWKRMQHLDEVAMDKNRLFKNRGGQLLKEEKERKHLENSLPRTDSQLEACLIQYQERTGNVFLWHGKDLLKKIREDLEHRQNLKDSKKGVKKVDDPHKMAIDNDELPRQAVKRDAFDVPTENIALKPPKIFKKNQIQNPSSKRNNKGGLGLTPATDLSTDSIASYHAFQEQLEGALNSENIIHSNKKRPLQETNSTLRAHSSPTSSPIKYKTPRTPKTPKTPRTPGVGPRRCLITPKKWR